MSPGSKFKRDPLESGIRCIKIVVLDDDCVLVNCKESLLWSASLRMKPHL